MPAARAAMAMGSMPWTARREPSRPSSPTRTKSEMSLMAERAVGSEDADGDGEVEAGAFFLEVGGREVDGDAGGGKVEAGVLDGGADAVARLADGGVGEADGGEGFFLGFDAGEVDFHVDDVCVDAVDGGAASLEEHA